MWTYRLRYVRCGKPSCKTCASGNGHGPYWYGYEHRGNRVYSKYFGKRPTSTFVIPPADVPAPDPRWVFRGRMDYKTAMRIMGFTVKPLPADLIKRYRSLIFEHHPDHGGDTKIAAAITVAYKYLT